MGCCREFGVPVISDAAESLGANYKGRPAGSLGDISILSFNGNKIITCSGGGMLLSDNWLAGCLTGAAVGGFAGYIGGSYLSNLNQQAEGSRSSLYAQVNASNVTLAETRDDVAISRRMVQRETRKIADLNTKYRAGLIQNAAYETEIGSLEAKYDMLETAIKEAENNVHDMEKAAQEQREQYANPAKLEQIIATMNSELARMRSYRADLVAAIATIPDGIDKPSV
ncbi:MAG: DegT/DnrJ/EryC1/StrS family aminotransferase [Proteobacteria bacterium]|nr:DegT/DnrJ/EryC1/StrS family aminotransferase [Pseudomonadota bacterium]